MTQWMQCTTCYRCVLTNPTGICISCQSGFSSDSGPDAYVLRTGSCRCHDYLTPEEEEVWKNAYEESGPKEIPLGNKSLCGQEIRREN